MALKLRPQSQQFLISRHDWHCKASYWKCGNAGLHSNIVLLWTGIQNATMSSWSAEEVAQEGTQNQQPGKGSEMIRHYSISQFKSRQIISNWNPYQHFSHKPRSIFPVWFQIINCFWVSVLSLSRFGETMFLLLAFLVYSNVFWW
jgi:hypothetical protein